MSRLRRLLPFAVAIGAVLALGPVVQKWPSTHTIEVALDPPAEVVRVALVVSPAGDEPIFASTWTFEPGDAPPRVKAEVQGPTGKYEAAVEIERLGSPPSTRSHHLDLDGDRQVTLFPK